MKEKKKRSWVKTRHRVVTALIRALVGPLMCLRYRAHIRRFKDRRQMLVIANHETPYDQFFVSLALRRTVYYMANEDLLSMGALSRLISYLVAPIPIRKGAVDAAAVLRAKRVVREGGSVGVFPEGNRTYSGRACYIKETIAPFARALGLPIAIVRIEGGYGVHPRWSDRIRRGRMTAGVHRVIEPEEVAAMTDGELYELLCRELAVEEAAVTGRFRSRHSAEYLERALYTCPFCGLSRLRSRGCRIICPTCRREVEHLPTKELRGVGFSFPYRFVAEWYEAQCRTVQEMLPAVLAADRVFGDTVRVDRLCDGHRRTLSRAAELTVGEEGLRFALEDGELLFAYGSLTGASVSGRNKLDLCVADTVYKIRGDKRFCALKYVNLCYRMKQTEGGNHAGFLGI